MNTERMAERSVDTLQRIYAVVAGLAINEALKRSFLTSKSELCLQSEHLPQLIAFMITTVPFVHGMNRHLDENFTSSKGPTGRVMLLQLIIDFFVFSLEASLLFVLAVSVTRGVPFFCWWLALLSVDIIWPCLTLQFMKPPVRSWMCVNLLTVGAAALLLLGWGRIPDLLLTWTFAAGAVARTVVDYYVCWTFYFPDTAPKAP
jgi:hypothetical protein